MMKLTVHSADSAPEASKAILGGIDAELGFVPNVAGSVAESPVLLAAFDGLRRAVGSGRLDPVDREAAGLAVGVAVDNAYGVAFHSTVLGRLGVDEAEIDKMRSGDTPASQRLAVVCELARQIAITRGKVEEDVVLRANSAGLSSVDILEIVAECTFASLVGVIDNLAGRVELDEFLAPRVWE